MQCINKLYLLFLFDESTSEAIILRRSQATLWTDNSLPSRLLFVSDYQAHLFQINWDYGMDE